MNHDVSMTLIALLSAFNTVLIGLVGFLLGHELHDIKNRIVRMENTYFHKET